MIFGTVLFGRTLRLFQQKAIVGDQTLFGVGTFAGDATNTTLGKNWCWLPICKLW